MFLLVTQKYYQGIPMVIWKNKLFSKQRYFDKPGSKNFAMHVGLPANKEKQEY